jgi:hypothetical protein
MIMAEVSAMLPKPEDNLFFLRSYNDFMAYLLGWAAFIVINTGGVAAIAFIFSKYFEFFFRFHDLPGGGAINCFAYTLYRKIFPLEDFG